MKHKSLFLMTSLCGLALLTSGCMTCSPGPQKYPEQRMHEKHHKNKHEPTVFYQNYDDEGISHVHAKMFTRSSEGGDAEMGFVKFKETNDGLKMMVDLMYLRPGKIYTAQVYQCGACNDATCCATTPMVVDLPQIKSANGDRLQQSYIIRGLTATQLNNAQLVLTRDGGYKAAWGTLNQ